MEWINVNSECPNPGQLVWVAVTAGAERFTAVSEFDGDGFLRMQGADECQSNEPTFGDYEMVVTEWAVMEMPEPPK